MEAVADFIKLVNHINSFKDIAVTSNGKTKLFNQAILFYFFKYFEAAITGPCSSMTPSGKIVVDGKEYPNYVINIAEFTLDEIDTLLMYHEQNMGTKGVVTKLCNLIELSHYLQFEYVKTLYEKLKRIISYQGFDHLLLSKQKGWREANFIEEVFPQIADSFGHLFALTKHGNLADWELVRSISLFIDDCIGIVKTPDIAQIVNELSSMLDSNGLCGKTITENALLLCKDHSILNKPLVSGTWSLFNSTDAYNVFVKKIPEMSAIDLQTDTSLLKISRNNKGDYDIKITANSNVTELLDEIFIFVVLPGSYEKQFCFVANKMHCYSSSESYVKLLNANHTIYGGCDKPSISVTWSSGYSLAKPVIMFTSVKRRMKNEELQAYEKSHPMYHAIKDKTKIITPKNYSYYDVNHLLDTINQLSDTINQLSAKK
jgi:hypothetical protein